MYFSGASTTQLFHTHVARWLPAGAVFGAPAANAADATIITIVTSNAIRRAILSHANYSGVARQSALEKTLFACDELAGFITAVSLVKPSRSVQEVDTRSVRKKMKDKAFARSVSREDIVNGAQDLGIDLDQHIDFCIRAMQGQAKELGLAGTGAPQITTT